MEYRDSLTLELPFDKAMESVRSALADQGFGVLTEIDVKSTMKAKLDVEMDDYVILGACNPPLAYRALQAEPSIGILLPCNVVLRGAGPGQTLVEVVDPSTMVMLTGNDAIAPVAAEVSDRLRAVLDLLSSQSGAVAGNP